MVRSEKSTICLYHTPSGAILSFSPSFLWLHTSPIHPWLHTSPIHPSHIHLIQLVHLYASPALCSLLDSDSVAITHRMSTSSTFYIPGCLLHCAAFVSLTMCLLEHLVPPSSHPISVSMNDHCTVQHPCHRPHSPRSYSISTIIPETLPYP